MSTMTLPPEFRAAGTDLSERRRSGVSKGPIVDLVLPGDDGIIWGGDENNHPMTTESKPHGRKVLVLYQKRPRTRLRSLVGSAAVVFDTTT